MVHVMSTIRHKHLLCHTAKQDMAMNMRHEDEGIRAKAARGESNASVESLQDKSSTMWESPAHL